MAISRFESTKRKHFFLHLLRFSYLNYRNIRYFDNCIANSYVWFVKVKVSRWIKKSYAFALVKLIYEHFRVLTWTRYFYCLQTVLGVSSSVYGIGAFKSAYSPANSSRILFTGQFVAHCSLFAEMSTMLANIVYELLRIARK